MWLRTFLLVLLLFFVARAILRLLGGVRQGVSGGPTRAGVQGRPPVKMVADPVCGTFVVPGKALELARGRQTHYFCSEKCRDQWTAAH
jgi:YHS domain-containing protein